VTATSSQGAVSAQPRVEVLPAHLAATPILDYQSSEIAGVVKRVRHDLGGAPAPRAFVRGAHDQLSSMMRAVYSIDDARPSSRTVQLNAGSCAQRMACLEAIARGYGVPTRVRGLWLHKEFWRHRLPLLMPIMPARTLMPWPQFFIDGGWVDFDEVFGSPAELAALTNRPFSNKGASLFDAIRNAPVDLLGKTGATVNSSCDIAQFVAEDLGFFDTRDQVMAQFDRRSWIGRLTFNIVYGGRGVRRQPE
jgi:Transglutaminase-like superfamily